MNKALINSSDFDEFYTPRYAVLPILKYLDKSLIYWEPTDFGNSNIANVLRENGFKVVSSNVNKIDFLINTPDFDYDVIITNPPYSKKDLFLKRCYDLSKKFLLLMPLTALEGIYRHTLYNKFGIELIIYDKRINFKNDSKGNWFNTSWFCYGICKNPLNFEKLIVDKNENILEFSDFHQYDLFDFVNECDK